MERVKVFDASGVATLRPRDLAEALLQRFHTCRWRRKDGSRIRCGRTSSSAFLPISGWAVLLRRWSVGGLVQFHTSHKMSLLSHSTAYRELGRLVASAAAVARPALRSDYEAGFHGR